MTSPPLPHRHSGRQASALRESTRLSSNTANVAEARRFVRRTLGECEADVVVTDLELVASELFTNAIEHGNGDDIDVTVTCDGSRVTVTVTSHGGAEQVAPSDEWEVADPSSITGRGLGIVRALADRIDVRRRRGELRILVERRLPACT
jgi:anti-sigma regulatory factor (Ser/Thr protein kinase)